MIFHVTNVSHFKLVVKFVSPPLFVTPCRLWEMDSHKVLGAGGEFADVVQFVETVRLTP
jgi:hypothetical protein